MKKILGLLVSVLLFSAPIFGQEQIRYRTGIGYFDVLGVHVLADTPTSDVMIGVGAFMGSKYKHVDVGEWYLTDETEMIYTRLSKSRMPEFGGSVVVLLKVSDGFAIGADFGAMNYRNAYCTESYQENRLGENTDLGCETVHKDSEAIPFVGVRVTYDISDNFYFYGTLNTQSLGIIGVGFTI